MPRNNTAVHEVTEHKVVDIEAGEASIMRAYKRREVGFKPSSRAKITTGVSVAQQGPRLPEPTDIHNEKTALIDRIINLTSIYSELRAQLTAAIGHSDYATLPRQLESWKTDLDKISLDKKKLRSDVGTFNKQLDTLHQIVAVGRFFSNTHISLQPLESVATRCDLQLSTLNILYSGHLKYLKRQAQVKLQSELHLVESSKPGCTIM